MRTRRWGLVGVGGSLGLVVVVTLLMPVTAALSGAGPNAGLFHSWVNITTTAGSPPTGRQAFGMAYDPDLGAAVLFGGQDTYGSPLGDTWEFVHGHWKNMNLTSPAAPAARWSPGLIYDPSLHGVLLFGGQNNYLSSCGVRCAFNDSWLYNKTGWHNLTGKVAPPAGGGANLVYDTHDSYALFVGHTFGVNYLVVYRYAFGAWVNITAKVKGSLPLNGFFYADDPHDGYVILVGNDSGCSGAGSTWKYRSGVFTDITSRVGTSPTAKMGSKAIGYDPAAGGVVMTGGYDASCNVVAQTWFFTGGHWRNISTATGTVIPGRWDSRMVWDAKIGTKGANLVFSGNEATSGGSNSFGTDTWKLAP